MNKIYHFKDRESFYSFLKDNYKNINELFLEVKIGDPNNIKGVISYLDSVEVALCFGFIDSSKAKKGNRLIQRFSKRKKNSPFTELNKERCRRLIKLKEMSKDGLKAIPNLDEYKFPKFIIAQLKKDKEAYNFFIKTPKLYQNIRIYNVNFYYNLDKKLYKKALNNLIKKCHSHKLYGQWNDYGRLLSY